MFGHRNAIDGQHKINEKSSLEPIFCDAFGLSDQIELANQVKGNSKFF